MMLLFLSTFVFDLLQQIHKNDGSETLNLKMHLREHPGGDHVLLERKHLIFFA